ncbi:hypothetical protein HY991_00810 [Candidatus Micrarchaeota archaeon]|nr:hypothetical protein [Candidatus Micrarchaeota archaeon]
MNGLKIILVTCGSCGTKQLWNYETKAEVCPSCESTMVLKTVSNKDLQSIKEQICKARNGNLRNGNGLKRNGSSLSYSDYLIYKITANEVESIKNQRRMEKSLAAGRYDTANNPIQQKRKRV